MQNNKLVQTRAIRGAVLFAFLSALAMASFGQKSPNIHDGQSLFAAMHDRYQDVWYDSVAFQEKAITLNPVSGSTTEIWDEALQLPGKLRINKGASVKGNGFVLNDGKLTTFHDGQPSSPRTYVHLLLVLGFDVYRQDVMKTIEQVQSQKFDLSQIHEESWEGEAVYVVGAPEGDLKSNQFWIEKKRLLFVRLIQVDDHDPGKVQDSRFEDYRKISNAWISAHVEFYTNGRNVFNEDYFNIRPDVKLDPALFDAAKFSQTSLDNYLHK